MCICIYRVYERINGIILKSSVLKILAHPTTRNAFPPMTSFVEI